ncbi:D-alanyl-D-alanine carboxypeptidase family protein [Methylobacterium symbioticum]|uniref:D-alanyl-D-alanine carboxypeptidase DacA n=1 Tax=Methylobacterium symbioticum TaxID=2584084 RepID=A0A509EMV1_9HYPH|nr:D-alanyl-D-alanine carboxypeptidase family protein [Methylobacterium symbioticum]VUD74745.1 D-alanyl-D-alanine carboxypeptidase DacA [Methylobacterium symbioticum]
MSNRILRRLTGAFAALAGLVAAGTAQAVTAPILVVDVDSGKVIYGQAATDPWYPASITKLMTAYVALDLVRQGRASLNSLITISPTAAAEPPSKMGFRPGTQLTLDNALKIIMVKSANDVAWAIGESLGGSVENFAGMMNETAQRIGMRESRWTNPNGLPDAQQWTSARDMAVLARALMRDFPDSRDLFSISAIQFGKAVMANHNGLLGRYAGADGMKTGFICSGGFNVVASATRNGRRIVAVVMGQPSARERDLKTADLFDYAFTQSAGWTSQSLESLSPSASPAPPDMRPYICGGKKAPAIDEGPGAIAASGAEGAVAQFMGATAASSPAAAMAAFSSTALRNRTLPPRAPLQPVAVWIGRDPAEGQALLAQQENAAKTAAAEARQAKLEAAKAKREAAKEAARQAQAARAEKAAQAKAAAKPEKPATTRAAAKPAPKKPQGALPQSATAYTSVEAPTMPGAKHAAKPAAKPAPKAAAKPAPKPAKPAAKKAQADE